MSTLTQSAAAAVVVLGLALGAGAARAAIDPAHYQQAAAYRVQVHQTARVVQETRVQGHRWRRVTLVGTVKAVHAADAAEGEPIRVGAVITIDYTVDLDAREQAAADWRREVGTMPGPQFLAEPDPPVLDAEGDTWAHVAAADGEPGRVERHAGAVVAAPGDVAEGAVFVPAAAQYSFDPPLD